jgi:hypothetical protein
VQVSERCAHVVDLRWPLGFAREAVLAGQGGVPHPAEGDPVAPQLMTIALHESTAVDEEDPSTVRRRRSVEVGNEFATATSTHNNGLDNDPIRNGCPLCRLANHCSKPMTAASRLPSSDQAIGRSIWTRSREVRCEMIATARSHAALSEEELLIESVVAKWHQHLRGELPGGIEHLLDDDVVFYSPIVFTPQRGKEITSLYLQAAAKTFSGDGERHLSDEPHSEGQVFRYTKTVMSGDTAVLEFETTMQGKYVNGVDIITCNDEGRIVEFRVMIRPLQAVNVVHQLMASMLEEMAPRA